MKKLALILLLLTNVALSFEEDSYRFGTLKFVFVSDYDKRLTISKNCLKNGKFNCLAYQTIKKASLKAIEDQLFGGMNPGSKICSDQLRGTVVLGKDDKGNENSFCKFSDESIIDNGTLTYYGIKNDK